MMKWVVRVVLAGAVIALGIWAWHHFFPNPETEVRNRLLELAKAASFSPGESPLSKVGAPKAIVDMCTDDIEISVDVQGMQRATLSGKDDLRFNATIVRARLGGLSVEFLDITVTLTPNKQGAVANLTAKIKIPSEKEFFPQELKFTLKKVNGKWLIRKIETVRTLSLKDRIHLLAVTDA